MSFPFEFFDEIDHMNCAAHHMTRRWKTIADRFRPRYPKEKVPETKILTEEVPRKPLNISIVVQKSRLPAHLCLLATALPSNGGGDNKEVRPPAAIAEPSQNPNVKGTQTETNSATENSAGYDWDSEVHLINETPRIYAEVTLRYLKEMNAFSSDRVQWVHKILNNTEEEPKIVFEDPDPMKGFILMPYAGHGKSLHTFHLVAIVHIRSVRSLRDVHAVHLPLLWNVWEKGTEAIKEEFGFIRSQVHAYINYQPTFYHLHVHFTSRKYSGPGQYSIEESHALHAIIANIKSAEKHYMHVTLPFILKKGHILYNNLKNYGSVSKF